MRPPQSSSPARAAGGVAAAALVLLGACGTAEAFGPEFIEVGWRLVSVRTAEGTVDATALQVPATARFTPDTPDGFGGRLAGHGGCNDYEARYSADALGGIAITAFASTLRVCTVESGLVENAFFAVLLDAASYLRGESTLVIRSTRGETLTFETP